MKSLNFASDVNSEGVKPLVKQTTLNSLLQIVTSADTYNAEGIEIRRGKTHMGNDAFLGLGSM